MILSHPQRIEQDNFAPTATLMAASASSASRESELARLPEEPAGKSVKRRRMRDPLHPAPRRDGARPATPLPTGAGSRSILARRWPDSDPYRLGAGWRREQALNPDSRVMLGDEADGFGLRRIRFDWRLTELDYHTMRTALLALGAHLAEQDLGRLRIDDWLLADRARRRPARRLGGYHQMCTTRMATTRARAWSTATAGCTALDNLYIGGSSVFATPSFATRPTPSCSWRSGSATISAARRCCRLALRSRPGARGLGRRECRGDARQTTLGCQGLTWA